MNKTDTSPEAIKVMNDLYRKMTPDRKIELVFDACRTGQLLAMAGIRIQYPNATDRQVWHLWAKRHLGNELYDKVYGGSKK